MNFDSDLNSRHEDAVADGLALARKVSTALIIIGVGVVLLLNQLGVLPPRLVSTFWPVLLVIGGLVQLLSGRGLERLLGAGLVLTGVLLQLNRLGILHFELRDLWPIFIIAAGAALLWATVREKLPASMPRSTVSEFNAVYIFSGTDRKVDTKSFRGGKITAVFGGFKIDLTRAEMEGNEALLEVDAVFGGGEIVVPETWKVVGEGSGVFGAFEDKTRHFQPDASQPAKTLIIRGAAVFGGVVVRNPR